MKNEQWKKHNLNFDFKMKDAKKKMNPYLSLLFLKLIYEKYNLCIFPTILEMNTELHFRYMDSKISLKTDFISIISSYLLILKIEITISYNGLIYQRKLKKFIFKKH